MLLAKGCFGNGAQLAINLGTSFQLAPTGQASAGSDSGFVPDLYCSRHHSELSYGNSNSTDPEKRCNNLSAVEMACCVKASLVHRCLVEPESCTLQKRFNVMQSPACTHQ